MTSSTRLAALFAALLLVALLLAALVAALPAEWQGPIAGLPAAPVTRTTLTPGPGAILTPNPTTANPGPGRFGRPDDPLGPGGLAILGVRRESLNGFASRLASLVTLLFAGLITLYLIPRRLGHIAVALRGGWNSRVRLFALGLVTALLLAAFGILAVITLVGTPIWLGVLSLGYFGALVGLAAISLPLGRWLTYRAGLSEQTPPVDLLLGLLIIFILSELPLVGGLALLAAALLGLGAVLQTRGGSSQPWTTGLPDLEY